MRRREFIVLLSGAAVGWPLDAGAQRVDRMRRVGVLLGRASTDAEGQQQARALEQALSRLGWTDANLQIDIRWAAGDADRIPALARELVDARPDVIVGQATPIIAAVLRETHTIPVVFVAITDPIGSGFVASLSRPGGNATGFVDLEPSLGAKWVELLKEIAPGLARVGYLFNPETSAGGGSYYLDALQSAAASSGIETVATSVGNAAAIEAAVTALAREPTSGLIVMPDIFNAAHQQLIISLAARNRIPAVYAFRFFPAGGGLLSYGINMIDLYRRAASYVDRILRGASPADLPVQLPTKFELVINLKTAKDLGLTIPPSIMVRADEVIE
jgi:putative tryptophan/tyrosine transport system substrate-binding protein